LIEMGYAGLGITRLMAIITSRRRRADCASESVAPHLAVASVITDREIRRAAEQLYVWTCLLPD
jgi:hypothetical protein